jgi:hypothetical protein
VASLNLLGSLIRHASGKGLAFREARIDPMPLRIDPMPLFDK